MLVREIETVLLATSVSAKPGEALADEVTAYFDQLRYPLLRYLGSFGLHAHDGEEVTQDVFLALFEHLRRGGARTNLRSWIFRVAHNLGLRRCHRRRAEAKLFAGEEAAQVRFDPAPNPEERWYYRQRQTRLLAVVEALPAQDRRCLYLRAEGLRYREITTVLGMSLGAVALSLSRSLARLSRADGR